MFLSKPDISIILPVYNESGNIENVIHHAVSVMNVFTDNYEIITVNDGSSDGTLAILENLSQKYPRLRVIQHTTNLGYGAAVLSGLKNARLDYIFWTDSDGQFDMNELTDLYPLLSDCDMAVGYRMHRQDPLNRKINTWLWNRLMKILFHTGVKDVDCAFKLFKRKVIDSIHLNAKGAMLSTEFIVKTRKAGFKIKESGVHHYPRKQGTASGANIKVIFRAFKELFNLYSELK